MSAVSTAQATTTGKAGGVVREHGLKVAGGLFLLGFLVWVGWLIYSSIKGFVSGEGRKNYEEDKKNQDCEMSGWESRGCIKTGDGEWKKEFKRHPLLEQKGDGKLCPPEEDWIKYEDDDDCVPKDCKMGPWVSRVPGQECKKDLTDGKYYTDLGRIVMSNAKYGGESCGPQTKREECKPVDCQFKYEATSECKYNGDGGFDMVVTPKIIKESQFGGKPCPSDEEIKYQTCTPEPCKPCKIKKVVRETGEASFSEGITDSYGQCVPENPSCK